MTSPARALAEQRPALLLSVLAILCGFSFGGLFGLMEDDLKAGLQASADAVLEERYGGDAAAADAVASKAWTYYKRAHMHWGGIGAATLALSILLALLDAKAGPRRLASLALGLGALLYPVAWLLAGRSAPGLGSTGAAKETWALVFQVPSALLLLGTVAALVLVATAARGRGAGA